MQINFQNETKNWEILEWRPKFRPEKHQQNQPQYRPENQTCSQSLLNCCCGLPDVHVLDVAGEAGGVAEDLGAVLADERLPRAVVVGEGARGVDVAAPLALLVLAVGVVQAVVVVLGKGGESEQRSCIAKLKEWHQFTLH